MSSYFSKPFDLDSTVRLLLGICIAVSIILLFRYLSPVLLPFFIAWLIAYILYPIVRFTEKKLRIKSRTVSVLLVLTTVFTVISATIYAIAPTVFTEMTKLKDFLVHYATDESIVNANTWQALLQSFIINAHIPELLEDKNLFDLFDSVFPFAQFVLNNSLAVAGVVVTFFISLLYLFFILKDYQTINQHFIALTPQKYQPFISGLMSDLEQGMNNYYRGQILVVFIVGILYATGFYLINMPVGILMGLFIGLLNFVPYLQIIGIPPCILLILVHSANTGASPITSLILLAIVFIIVQIIQDALLVPNIMGRKLGLNAAIILLSLSIFGMLFGIIGLIIALPITTLLISYYKRYILTKVNEKHKSNDSVKKTIII